MLMSSDKPVDFYHFRCSKLASPNFRYNYFSPKLWYFNGTNCSSSGLKIQIPRWHVHKVITEVHLILRYSVIEIEYVFLFASLRAENFQIFGAFVETKREWGSAFVMLMFRNLTKNSIFFGFFHFYFPIEVTINESQWFELFIDVIIYHGVPYRFVLITFFSPIRRLF